MQLLLRVPQEQALRISWLDQNVLGIVLIILQRLHVLDIRICKHDKRREAFASRASVRADSRSEIRAAQKCNVPTRCTNGSCWSTNEILCGL